MKIVFAFIGIVALIIIIVLLLLGLPMAAIIDLGGNVNTKFLTVYTKVIGILFVISVIAGIISALL